MRLKELVVRTDLFVQVQIIHVNACHSCELFETIANQLILIHPTMLTHALHVDLHVGTHPNTVQNFPHANTRHNHQPRLSERLAYADKIQGIDILALVRGEVGVQFDLRAALGNVRKLCAQRRLARCSYAVDSHHTKLFEIPSCNEGQQLKNIVHYQAGLWGFMRRHAVEHTDLRGFDAATHDPTECKSTLPLTIPDAPARQNGYMGNPSILGRPAPDSPPVPRWTPQKHNGILGWIEREVRTLAEEKLPPAESLARNATHQVVVQHPEIGAVRITFAVKRAAGRYKGVARFWCAVFAEIVDAPARS